MIDHIVVNSGDAGHSPRSPEIAGAVPGNGHPPAAPDNKRRIVLDDLAAYDQELGI